MVIWIPHVQSEVTYQAVLGIQGFAWWAGQDPEHTPCGRLQVPQQWRLMCQRRLVPRVNPRSLANSHGMFMAENR